MKKTTFAAMLVAGIPTVGHAEKWEKVITLYGWVPGIRRRAEHGRLRSPRA